MRTGAKKMRCFWPIGVVSNNTYWESHRTYTIDRIPAICRSFFRPLRKNFDKPAWPHFWGLERKKGIGPILFGTLFASRLY